MNDAYKYLAIALSVSALAACGNSEDPATGDDSGSSALVTDVTVADPSTTLVSTADLEPSEQLSTISADDFFVDYSPSNPGVFSTDGNMSYTKTPVTITIYVSGRSDLLQIQPTNVKFATSWGTFIGSDNCTTNESGQCSVTWESGDYDTAPQNCVVGLTAYTVGEEAFHDNNGNGIFDDGDGFAHPVTFQSYDLEEPYVDYNGDGLYSFGTDRLIDVSGFSVNGLHDAANGLWDGPDCAHSTLCGNTTTMISDQNHIVIQTEQWDHDGDGGTVDRFFCNFLP